MKLGGTSCAASVGAQQAGELGRAIYLSSTRAKAGSCNLGETTPVPAEVVG